MQKKSSGSVRIFYPKYSGEEAARILKERIKKLREVLPVEEAYLIGSYARGNYTAASDIDILIVYKGKDEEAYKKAHSILDMPRLEILIYSSKEYERLRNNNPLSLNILLKDAVKLTTE